LPENTDTIDMIARGPLASGGSTLLTHKIAEENTFLPGGQIRKGECVRQAFLREIREEGLGCRG